MDRPAGRRKGETCSRGPVGVQNRLWFNEANESRSFLVPGTHRLVMTLIGAMLTSLVMAREWERGTFEALFVTPVRIDEILLGKTIPVFPPGDDRLGALPAGGEISVSRSVSRLAPGAHRCIDALYLLVALGIGLFDFVVGQKPVRREPGHDAGDLPAGDDAVGVSVRSAEHARRGAAAHLRIAGRYYVALLQTIFLAGDVWGIIVPNTAVLAAMAAVLALLTRRDAQRRSLRGKNAQPLADFRPDAERADGDSRGSPQPLDAHHAADHAVLHLWVRGDVRLDRCPLRRARSGPEPGVARSAGGPRRIGRLSLRGYLNRADDLRTAIDEQRAVVALQFGQDFERRLNLGLGADVQVIADGRNSNTAATAPATSARLLSRSTRTGNRPTASPIRR